MFISAQPHSVWLNAGVTLEIHADICAGWVSSLFIQNTWSPLDWSHDRRCCILHVLILDEGAGGAEERNQHCWESEAWRTMTGNKSGVLVFCSSMRCRHATWADKSLHRGWNYPLCFHQVCHISLTLCSLVLFRLRLSEVSRLRSLIWIG